VTAPWSRISRRAGGGIEIAYQVTGPASGEPLLLVAGLGAQMLYWHDDLCAILVDRGFSVARFDNRDVGLSTHVSARPRGRVRTLLRPASVAAYGLDAMVGDAISVLDALDWKSAHVLGCSLGGALAQQTAISHPARVTSLISVMSTPSLRIGRGKVRALASLVRGPVSSREAAQHRRVELYRRIGSPGYALDEEWLRGVAAQEYERAYDPDGVLRQLAALLVSGDRRPALAGLAMPALVLHGEQDPVFRVSGGAATAAAVPGARFVTYAGMGHDLPRPLWPAIADEIAAVAGR
jgi:pimeloyl-ACP methyl ester carboxylesterase